jgi:hypothetical protein
MENQPMQKQYVAPELKLVGEADQVVLGSNRIGFDFDSQMMPCVMEFEIDDGVACELPAESLAEE